jgi:hypothetical protein
MIGVTSARIPGHQSLRITARGNAFEGRVLGVQIAIAEAAERLTHIVSSEDALRVATARQ